MLLPVKRIINFVKADVSREDSFSRPVKRRPLYGADYKRYVKIVRALTEQPRCRYFSRHFYFAMAGRDKERSDEVPRQRKACPESEATR